MSRSVKKNPFGPIACSWSNKSAKRENNRRLRRKAKLAIANVLDFDAMLLPERKDEVMNRYDYPDDGKHYYGRYLTWLQSEGFCTQKVIGK